MTGVCILLALSFFSGCINVPKELTQFSTVSFDVEPGIINQDESANLCWVVMKYLFGQYRITELVVLLPQDIGLYNQRRQLNILTISNSTQTKNATVKITVKYESDESPQQEKRY